ncbi:TIGR03747 family integrating conjugative element membrane protein [Ursidibacter maritimus]|uniref:TIGR03747 family integrating conjugative element membrane protein n=1 Tax=Ursidibacter maritimus TaxID=1331689 RepID=A0A949T3P7_9PAST|nr:TIGR03747 family integrating conjugative element membrane protein [Ursidibacter maritimus]MBV6524448.1 TIGR03747 family integrating conjugative element membrane protein [Ursidibacter maritimus]MBV6526502.1 TIGR03747 family integrating conjugative element membrane protein [Ursidibacter maritimus]MBV6527094.1 TIGR03747 family integrating conjugative element membrane protein [Ursidibacter maritimus]MBV6530389.1 TIGR03747 family integrating conjugative element membrane protein [Ursidibacter mari
MAQNQQENSSPARKESSLPCRIVTTLIISLILSIIVEWLCITFVWPEQGHLHSKQVMQDELGWLSAEFQQSLIYSYPVTLAEQIIQFLHHWLFVKTGIQQLLNTPIDHVSDINFRQMNWDTVKNTDWLAYAMFYVRAYIESTLYVIIVFVIRLMIIVLTSPVFLLAGLVGLVDGLVNRDLRRFGVGRESAFKYHHAKRAVVPVMFIAWIVYLSLPFSIHPNLILIPAALLFGIMISLTASNFKKYL